MSYSPEDLAKLRSAIASGIKRVTMGGRTLEFDSIAAMREVEKDIARAQAPRRRRFSIVEIDCG